MTGAADPAEEKDGKDKGRWTFKPRQLDITWGGDSKYWKMPEEGTDDPAELLAVVWLEIKGSISEPLSKGKRYALSFKISKTYDDPVWETYPVYMLAKVGKKGTSNWEKINLGELRVGDIIEIPSEKLLFTVPEKAKDTTLLFGLYELWSGEWKEGLRIHEANLSALKMSSSSKPHYEADPEKNRYDKDNNCWTFKPLDFNIIWGSDKRYWNLPDPDQQQSSADDTAPVELVQVCWLEVTGTTGKTPVKPGRYRIKFEVSMKGDAFGWNCPVYVIAKSGKKGRYSWKKIDLSEVKTESKSVPPDFQIDVKDQPDNTIYFGLYEVWSGKWKGGLRIHKAIVEGPLPQT
ncbi:hypothetical protein SADUNF_Sadunf15G0103000 [Salix dunnii]|uniref:Uncharacterized protein n=1 Tax=Salix dunnii TaxID=1413687 RepID=A0A835JJB8_9ROSI|nr:hypothetical protein SADUNF_Sadunf15G0103000 [Salix dunnii]